MHRAFAVGGEVPEVPFPGQEWRGGVCFTKEIAGKGCAEE